MMGKCLDDDDGNIKIEPNLLACFKFEKNWAQGKWVRITPSLFGWGNGVEEKEILGLDLYFIPVD